MSKVLEVTDATFENEVSKSTIPVLVDFWAPWCGPCRTMSSVLEELVPKYEGKVKIAKLNVDENRLSSGRFSVQSIPYLVFFKGGLVVKEMVGATPPKIIEEALQKILS